MAEPPLALLLTGPTASGKSALAIGLAQRLPGTVINADAMQCYRELRILTARPSTAEEALVPHRLYGVRAAAEPGDAAWWRREALAAMAEAQAAGRLPIVCGGSGLYFWTLVRGIAAIPPPSAAARAEARRLLAELGPVGLHQALAAVDRATAARLRPSDSQRVARAWEVWRSTGQGLAAWQAQPPAPPPWRFVAIHLDPVREELRAAIAARLTAMLAQGALDEVQALARLHLPPSLPLMRAHGVPEFLAYLEGRLSLAEARRQVERAIGQYTKRQATWFRHRLLVVPERLHTIHARIAGVEQFSERDWHSLISFIRKLG